MLVIVEQNFSGISAVTELIIDIESSCWTRASRPGQRVRGRPSKIACPAGEPVGCSRPRPLVLPPGELHNDVLDYAYWSDGMKI